MNKLTSVFGFAAALPLAGCWTFSETPYPASAVTAAPTNSVPVVVAGFEAMITEYESVHGYQTVYVPGYHGRHHYEPGYFETVPTVTMVAQQRSSDMFLKRAQDELEDAGFAVSPAGRYIVEVTFSGPFKSNGDASAEICWPVFTLFTVDYGAADWSAKLRVREAGTGRLVFHHEYTQHYETKVFGLIPLFSIAECPNTGRDFIQSWCLAALTDRAVADASAFLSTLK